MTVHPTLREIADLVIADAMQKGRYRELKGPLLALIDHDGHLQRFQITTPGVHPSEVMKTLVFLHLARHAAIIFEGWGVSEVVIADDGNRDENMRRALRGQRPIGMLPPSQHPNRVETLTLVAQSRGGTQDDSILRSWEIANGTERTFVDRPEWSQGGTMAPSNFWPMFELPSIVEAIIARSIHLVRLREQVRGRRS
jgi:hypothetical protein